MHNLSFSSQENRLENCQFEERRTRLQIKVYGIMSGHRAAGVDLSSPLAAGLVPADASVGAGDARRLPLPQTCGAAGATNQQVSL